MGNVLSAVPFVGVPVAAGAVIGISLAPEIKGWYKTIKKPSWNPPNWIFGPTWTALYTMMGVASWRVWRAGGGPVPLGLYATQLALNLAWSPTFFKLHSPKAAALDITALLGVLAATIVKFDAVDRTAAALMLPYAAWSAFATALTYEIWRLNGDRSGAAAAAAPAEQAKKAE